MLINYYLFSRKNRYGEYPVRISANIMQTRMMTTIGISVKKEKWNANKQIVKNGYVNHKGLSSEEINGRLEEIREKFRLYEKTIIRKPTEMEMRQVLSGKAGTSRIVERISAAELMDVFIREESLSNQWTSGTVETFISLKKHLTIHCGKQSLEYFNDEGLYTFMNYLRYDCKMMESTIKKEFKCLKWFLNWAVRKGMISDKVLFHAKPKMKILEQPVIYLTKEELMRLYEFRFPDEGTLFKIRNYSGKSYHKVITNPQRMEIVRDMFCFCAFTSLRYSDMIRLKITDITDDILFTTTKKTNDRLPINLNSFSKDIISRYKKIYHDADGFLFPRISNVEMNIKIKEVCELTEINAPVTKVYIKGGKRVENTKPKYSFVGTHAGRKTFICFALASGIPPQVVMKWTGHSDYAAMRPYIEIAETTKMENMAFLDKKLKE